MRKKKLQCSVPTLLLTGVLCLTLAACGAKQSSDMPASDTDSAASAALPVKAMNAKRVDENPYMANPLERKTGEVCGSPPRRAYPMERSEALSPCKSAERDKAPLAYF